VVRFGRKRANPSVITLADQARDQGQWGRAAELYREALRRNPYNAPIWVQYGHMLKESGQLGRAETAYRRAIEVDGTSADTHLQLGHVLKLQNKRDEAAAAYLRAIAIDPGLVHASTELTTLGWSKEQLSQLGAFAQQVSAATGQFARYGYGRTAHPARRRRRVSIITRADRAQELGQWELAARLYRQVLDRNPRNPAIWVQYGHVLKQRALLEEAEHAYRRGIAYDPGAADSHAQLGHALKLQGRTEEAQSCYLRALVLDPKLSAAAHELTGLGWSGGQVAELKILVEPRQPATAQAEIAALPNLAQSQRIAQEQVPTAEAFEGEIVEFRGVVAHAAQQAQSHGHTRVLPPTSRQFRVLYVSGPPDSPSHRYRVTHYIEALSGIGIDAEWIPAGDYENGIHRLRGASLVVLFRVEMAPALSRFIEAAERLRVPVVYDIDDYVFEPQIATPTYIDGIRGWSEPDIEGYRSGVRAYRAALLSCQFATFTTNFLVERGEELGRRSFLLPNGLDYHTLEFSEEAIRARAAEPRDGLVRLGYAGGTRTHQRDFAECAKAVAAVLQEFPECRLVLFRDGGNEPFVYPAEFPSFHGLEDRVEWHNFVPFDRMPAEVARFDINLAPLEIGNPFCEAKSDLKYFEAACLAVPTVASATPVFHDAIRHGETGFLAESEEDWHNALTALVRDRSLREKVSAAARKHALEAYSPGALARAAQEAYGEIIRSYRAGLGRGDATLTVTLVLRKYEPGSGTHAQAIALMRGLSQRGHDVALHFPEDNFETGDDIRREHGLYETVAITFGPQQMRPSDLVIANSWQTAYMLYDLPGCARAKVYLMPDYEPVFYPASEAYIAAEQSYRLGLRHVSYGPWVRHRLKQEIGVEADWIPFFIDKSLFRANPQVPRSNDRLIVYVRPEIQHRLSELSAATVGSFVSQTGFNGNVEFFGSDVRLDLPFPHTWHGKIDPRRMAALFRKGTLGVAISPTNTSMVAFEMMACGMPVIDIDYNDNYISYGCRENVCLLQPDPQSLAHGIARLMADEKARDLLSQNALRFVAQMPDKATVAARFEQLLKAYLDPEVAPSYCLERVPVLEGPCAVSEHEHRDLGQVPERGVDNLERINPANAPRFVPGEATSISAPRRPHPGPLRSMRLRIDWVLIGLDVGGGGTRNIMRAAHYLETFGHDVGLQCNFPGLSVDEIKGLIQAHFYPFHGPIKIYDGVSRPLDVIIATQWGTVAPALAACPSGAEVMYFVQDFEPSFYPMSNDYILAENTYRHGLYCICSGAWCSQRMRLQFGLEADHFGYPLDRSIFFPRPRQKSETNVVFFARPEMPRRCYGLGVAMLREFHRLMPEVEIIMYGSSNVDPGGFDFPVTVRGVLPTLDDLAQIYSDADLGIAFATTNPSMVPYEMMACGLPVVDVARAGAEVNYGNGFDTVFLASPVPRQMAAQVRDLLMNPAERQARSQKGVQLTSLLPTEEEMVRQIESLILTRLQSRSEAA
jgi:glycosyltransferase involved in cell wall biosynthesis/tetratricopeptide (TPR) repeat protein